ncbi:MAG TPA: STM3941 family protein, partial [Ktedonobacterales bacterium]
VGVTLIASGLIVGIGEITGYAISLIAGIGPMAYIWRAMNRSLGVRKPAATEPPELAPVLFRHDSESIVLYPNRRKLAGHALLFGGVMLVLGALAVVLRSAGLALVLGLGAFILLFLLACLIPDLARLLRPWPTLTVTSDGIIDRGSGLVTGFGLIPWHEIEDVVGGVSATRYGLSYLWIIPANRERLLARQPHLKRPLLRLVTAMTGDIGIASLYLAQPPVEVAARIRAYVLSHAPASYLAQEDAVERAPDDLHKPPDATLS